MELYLKDPLGMTVIVIFMGALVLLLGAAIWHFAPRAKDQLPRKALLDYNITIDRTKALVITFTPLNVKGQVPFKIAIYMANQPQVKDLMHRTTLSPQHCYSFYLGESAMDGDIMNRLLSLLIGLNHDNDLDHLQSDRAVEYGLMFDLFKANELYQSGSYRFYTRELNDALINAYYEIKHTPTNVYPLRNHYA